MGKISLLNAILGPEYKLNVQVFVNWLFLSEIEDTWLRTTTKFTTYGSEEEEEL